MDAKYKIVVIEVHCAFVFAWSWDMSDKFTNFMEEISSTFYYYYYYYCMNNFFILNRQYFYLYLCKSIVYNI